MMARHPRIKRAVLTPAAAALVVATLRRQPPPADAATPADPRAPSPLEAGAEAGPSPSQSPPPPLLFPFILARSAFPFLVAYLAGPSPPHPAATAVPAVEPSPAARFAALCDEGLFPALVAALRAAVAGATRTGLRDCADMIGSFLRPPFQPRAAEESLHAGAWFCRCTLYTTPWRRLCSHVVLASLQACARRSWRE